MRRHSSSWMFLATAMAACASAPDDRTNDADSDAAKPTDEPELSSRIDEDGDSLTLGAASLEIPPAALREATEITMRQAPEDEHPPGYDVRGGLFEFGPKGAVFEHPVRVSVPYDGESGTVLWWSTLNGAGFEPVASEVQGDRLVGWVEHFSFGFAGRADSDECDAVTCDEPPGATCDGDVAIVSGQGTCDAGACLYAKQRFDCANLPSGAAACADGTCTGLTCDNAWANCNGDVFDGCETLLTTTANCGACGNACADGESCSGGACTTECTENACGGCSDLEGQPGDACGCEGLSTDTCVPGQWVCDGAEDVDCEQPDPCTDITCAPGERCIDGSCRPLAESQCDNDQDDDGDGLSDCNDADCLDRCASGPVGEDCTNGTDDDGDGATDCSDDDCSANSACEQSTGCMSGVCPPGTICQDDACKQLCTTADDCAPGEICQDSVCGPCTANNDCAPGRVCRDGACKQVCMTADDCAAGEICQDSVCGLCTVNADCPSGQDCIDNLCQRP